MEFLDSIADRLSLNELERFKPVKDFADKIGVKVAHLALGVIGLLCLAVVFQYGATVISFGVGFLYPAYMSFKTVELKDNKKEDRLWLTYWLVFGFIHVLDDFLGIILYFLPLYNVMKILFYIWLFHPKTEGAMFVYDKILKGLLKKYEDKIDSGIQKIKEKADEAKPLLEAATAALKKEKEVKEDSTSTPHPHMD